MLECRCHNSNNQDIASMLQTFEVVHMHKARGAAAIDIGLHVCEDTLLMQRAIQGIAYTSNPSDMFDD